MAALILPVAVWGLSLVMVQRPLGFRLALINSMPPSLIYRSTSYSLIRTTNGDGYRCVPRAAVLGSIRVIGTMPTHPMGPPLPVFAVGGDPQPVDLVVRQGGAAAVLIDQSRDADLLVVGSRGHGGFAGLILGSVSTACAEHAHCPVLVVHGTRARTANPVERAALDL
jgi:hypothetical protein